MFRRSEGSLGKPVSAEIWDVVDWEIGDVVDYVDLFLLPRK
jgi:hypothetical protein